MTYEWDEAKSRANLAKHTVSFEEIELFDWNTAVYRASDRDGESRTEAIGYIGSILFLVVYTIRGENRRINQLACGQQKRKRNLWTTTSTLAA